MHEQDAEAMLTDHEARVLGCLMEKQMTTPEYYPLTLKALTAACNQKSSRVPVMNLSEGQVGGVVSGLRNEGLVTARMDGRADRFEHHLSRKLGLDSKQRAVVCVLLLRGPLTLNEIRINTSRMTEFDNNDAVQDVLDELMTRDEPIIMRLPRASGQREDRYAHLLCGEPEYQAPASPVPADDGGLAERLDRLEQEVARLKAILEELGQS